MSGETPVGWTVLGGGNTRSITLKPDNCSGGNIRVRGKSTSCSSNTYYSNWSTVKSVSRTLPSPGTILGPDEVSCNDQTLKTYSISAVTGATSYVWTYPSGWVVQGLGTTNSITLVPNGFNGGAVTVKAIGCVLQSTTSSKNITLNLADINNPPRILGASPVCNSGSTFTLTNIPANSTIIWSQSLNLATVSGQGTMNYTARANSVGTSGSGWVEALITTPCGNLPPIRYNFWVGNPPADNTTLIWSGTRGVNPIRTRPGSTYIFRVDQVPQTNSYTWILPAGFTVSGGNTTTTGTSIYITTSDISGTYTLYCRANNACGSSWTNSLTINNGSSSGGPNPLRVYPNPASESLIIEDDITELESMGNDPAKEVFTVKLVDNKGTNRRTGTSVNGRINISTHDLPDGLYILQIETKQGIEHRQILIKH